MTDRQSTHGPDCWGWGPKHYECAVNRIERLVEALRLALKWAEAVPPGEPLYKESEADLSAARAALRERLGEGGRDDLSQGDQP